MSDDFFQWSQGSTPKEYLGMRSDHWLRKEIADREEADKIWHSREAKSNKRWRIAEFVVVGIIAPLLIMAATVLAAFIQRGIWALPIPPSAVITPQPSASGTLSSLTPVASPSGAK